MSSKAYLFRLRHSEDIKEVETLVWAEDVLLSCVYIVNRKCLAFKKGDLAAAISTVDGELDHYLQFLENPKRRARYFKRLDAIPAFEKEQPDENVNGFRVRGWEVPKWSDSTWVKQSEAYLVTFRALNTLYQRNV